MQKNNIYFDHISVGGGLIGTLSTIEIVENIIHTIFINKKKNIIFKNISINFLIIDKDSKNIMGGIAYGYNNSKFGFFNNPHRLLNIDFKKWLKEPKNIKKIIDYVKKDGGQSGKKWFNLNRSFLLSKNKNISEIYFPRYSLSIWLQERFLSLNKKILLLKNKFNVDIKINFIESEITNIDKINNLIELTFKNKIKLLNLNLNNKKKISFKKRTVNINTLYTKFCTLGVGLFPTRKINLKILSKKNDNYIEDFYETGSTANLISKIKKIKNKNISVAFIGAKAGLLEALPELNYYKSNKRISLNTFSQSGNFIKKAKLSKNYRNIKLKYFKDLLKINTAKKIYESLKNEFKNINKDHFNEYDVWTKILKKNIIDKILQNLSSKEYNLFKIKYHDKVRAITRFTYPATVDIFNNLTNLHKINIINEKANEIIVNKQSIYLITDKKKYKFDLVINVSGPTNLYDNKFFYNNLILSLKNLQNNHKQAFLVNKNFEFQNTKNLYSPGALSLGFNPRRKTIINAIAKNTRISSKSICKKILNNNFLINKKITWNADEMNDYINSGGIYAPFPVINHLRNHNYNYLDNKDNKLYISFDGDTGSGKTVLSKFIAKKLGLIHIDSGYLFKALAFKLKENSVDISSDESKKILSILKKITILDILNNKLKNNDFSKYAAQISSLSFIRKPFLKKVKELISNFDRVSITGRDIGAKVLKEKNTIKFFLEVSQENSINRKHNSSNYMKKDAKIRFLYDKKITIVPKKCFIINTNKNNLVDIKKIVLNKILEL